MEGLAVTDAMVPWLNGVHAQVRQLAEDALRQGVSPTWSVRSPFLVAYDPDGLVLAPPLIAVLMPFGAPQVLLARVEMERALLGEHTPDEAGSCLACEGASMRRGEAWGSEPWPCEAWRAVARGWAHMPGYEQGWTP